MTTETRYFGNQLITYVVLAWLDLGGQGILTYLPEFCIHLYGSDFLDMEKKMVKIITVTKLLIQIGSYASSLIRFLGDLEYGDRNLKQNRGEQGFQ